MPLNYIFKPEKGLYRQQIAIKANNRNILMYSSDDIVLASVRNPLTLILLRIINILSVFNGLDLITHIIFPV